MDFSRLLVLLFGMTLAPHVDLDTPLPLLPPPTASATRIPSARAAPLSSASQETQPRPIPRVYPDQMGHTFAYIADGYSLRQYEVGADGALTPLDPPSVPTTGDLLRACADPTGRFVFSMDWAHGNVFRYATHPDGSLVDPGVLAAHIDGYPRSISFDSTGRRAYIVDDAILYRDQGGVSKTYNGGRGISRIYQFRLDADGALSPLTPAFAETEGTRPRLLRFTPDGRFAYAAESDGITQYAVNPDGALRTLNPPEAGAGADYDTLTVDPRGRFVYAFAEGRFGALSRFRIGADGRLTALPPLTLSFSGQPLAGLQSALAIEPTGQFAYIAPQEFGSQAPNGPPSAVYQYRIESDGGLTPLTPPHMATIDFSHAIGFDPDGRFAYVSGGSGGVAQYQVRPDGTLSALTPRVVPGGGQAAVSVVRRASLNGFTAALGAVSDAARRRQPLTASGAPDPNETFRPDDPRRADLFRHQEMPLVFAPSGKYAYVAHGSTDVVARFAVGADGVLSPLPAAASPGSSFPGSVALDPTGRYAYLIRGTEDKVAQFAVRPDGTFAPLTPSDINLDASDLVPSRDGRFLFAQGGFGDLSLLRIGPDGTLSPAAPPSGFMSHDNGPTTPDAYGVLPREQTEGSGGFTLSPSGRFAYLLRRTGQIAQYAVGSDGKPHPLSPPTVGAGYDPQALSFDPRERFAYAPNSLDGTVSQYRITKTGALTPLSPPTVIAGIFPLSVTISPSGRCAYVVDGGMQAVLYRDYATDKVRLRLIRGQKPHIRQFRVGSDGALSVQTEASLVTDMNGALVFGPTGRFAYQVNGSQVRAYRMNPDGILTEANKQP